MDPSTRLNPSSMVGVILGLETAPIDQLRAEDWSVIASHIVELIKPNLKYLSGAKPLLDHYLSPNLKTSVHKPILTDELKVLLRWRCWFLSQRHLKVTDFPTGVASPYQVRTAELTNLFLTDSGEWLMVDTVAEVNTDPASYKLENDRPSTILRLDARMLGVVEVGQRFSEPAYKAPQDSPCLGERVLIDLSLILDKTVTDRRRHLGLLTSQQEKFRHILEQFGLDPAAEERSRAFWASHD